MCNVDESNTIYYEVPFGWCFLFYNLPLAFLITSSLAQQVHLFHTEDKIMKRVLFFSVSAPLPSALILPPCISVGWECNDSRCGERGDQPHSTVPFLGEWERCSGPGPASATKHQLCGQCHHPPAPLSLGHRSGTLQAPTCYWQQQAESQTIFWGGLWVYRWVVILDRLSLFVPHWPILYFVPSFWIFSFWLSVSFVCHCCICHYLGKRSH